MKELYKEFIANKRVLIDLDREKAQLDMKIRALKERQSEITDKTINEFTQWGLTEDTFDYGQYKVQIKLTKPTGKINYTDIDKLPKEFISYEPKVDKKGLKEFVKENNPDDYGVFFEYGKPSIKYDLAK